MTSKNIVPIEKIRECIFILRGQKVMLDHDLAELYGVETKALNRAVKRNKERFPDDFMFRLAKQEVTNLRPHFGTSSWGGLRYLPLALTEQGVAMLSSVLRSKQAVMVNIEIMRAFVRLREIMASHSELAKKLDDLEEKYVKQFKVVFQAIRQLMTPPAAKSHQIGFRKDR